MNELGEARRLRLVASRSKLPTPMWMLLIGGGTITVAWLYLFYAKSSRRQMALVAVVGGYSGFVVFLVYALQHPFAGDVAITPDVYRDLLDSW